jgi:hypothetical protein
VTKVRFEGVVITENIDSQGDIIDVDGCDISKLENGHVFKNMDSIDVDGVVGNIVCVKKDVTEDGKKCVRVAVDLYDFPEDLNFEVPVGAFGIIIEKELVPCPGESFVGSNGETFHEVCDGGKLRDGPWGNDVRCGACRGSGKFAERITKASISGAALVAHPVHPFYVLRRSKS